MKFSKLVRSLVLVAVVTALFMAITASDGSSSDASFYGRAWALFPPVIAITLAFATKEVYSSLFLGVLAGAVTGDHCSPISETAIMSSTAAQVEFMQHVMTQLPYAGFVAAMSSIGFLLAGFIQNALICLPLVIALMVVTLVVVKRVGTRRGFAYVRES